jgi:hypothetical protein
VSWLSQRKPFGKDDYPHSMGDASMDEQEVYEHLPREPEQAFLHLERYTPFTS